MRLLLFDIDGTLVQGGPAKSAFGTALSSVFGTAGPIAGHDFAGKTDPRIARELLLAAGLTSAEIEAGLPRFWDRYLSELARRIPSDPASPCREWPNSCPCWRPERTWRLASSPGTSRKAPA